MIGLLKIGFMRLWTKSGGNEKQAENIDVQTFDGNEIKIKASGIEEVILVKTPTLWILHQTIA